jgi:hypothetical protein
MVFVKQSGHSARARRGRRCAFTLIDVCVAVATLGVVLALTGAGLSASRRSAQQQFCAAKLQVIGAGNARFALAHEDRMAGFLATQNGVGTTMAHAQEAVTILRARGRPDITPISNWIPDALYWSLSLVEFEDRALGDPFNICPSDDLRNKWRRHPQAFDQGRFLPLQPAPSAINKRWPYASSYILTAAAFDHNQSREVAATGGAVVDARLGQSGFQHSSIQIPPGHDLGPSPMPLVAFPSQKAHVFEQHQRHFPGVDLFFMYDQARTPILFFDGSVRVQRSGDARPGWNPIQPGSPVETRVLYTPSEWEPPLASGQPFPATELLNDSHRWTRDGLLGWDYQD